VASISKNESRNSVDTPIEFFGTGPAAIAWADGLEERRDGYWPRFDDHVLLAALAQVAGRSWWDEWGRITCPTLVIRGDRGRLSLETADRMASSLVDASVVTIADAGHDVHLDQAQTLVQELRHCFR
jgi:pimeloyl-ACP methyl ester carboxylesterase